MRIFTLLGLLTLTALPAVAGPPEAPAPPAAEAAPGPDAPGASLQGLQDRVGVLEQEVARLRGAAPNNLQPSLYTGPPSRDGAPAWQPTYTSQATVLSERGVPTRIEWGSKGRILYYGRERWSFDDQGQLLSIQRDK
jgi:hypothetical protein